MSRKQRSQAPPSQLVVWHASEKLLLNIFSAFLPSSFRKSLVRLAEFRCVREGGAGRNQLTASLCACNVMAILWPQATVVCGAILTSRCSSSCLCAVQPLTTVALERYCSFIVVVALGRYPLYNSADGRKTVEDTTRYAGRRILAKGVLRFCCSPSWIDEKPALVI